MRLRHHPVLDAVVLAVVLVAGCRGARRASEVEQERVVPVAVRAAETGAIRTVVNATGAVTPAEGAEFLVVAPEAARVVEITKAEGDAVMSGELLVRFELPASAEMVARERAELDAAQAQLENARVAHTRTRDFVERGLVPRRDLDTADRELADAQMSIDRARAAYDAAETAASRAVARAPFSGLVAKRLHNPGDLVQASPTDPVLRLIDPSRLEVTASIPAADSARALPGASARIAGLLDGRVIPLRVVGADGIRAADDETVRVRLTFVEPVAIAVDTSVEVDIDAEERTDVVFVSPNAIVREGGESVVFVAAGTTAERRVVTTGIADAQRVELTSGVEAGELVITRGHVGLSPGAVITATADAR